MENDTAKKLSAIAEEVDKFRSIFGSRHGTNYRWNALLVGLGIVVACSVALSGIANKPELAAALGVFSTALFALQGAYALGEKAEFQRIIALEAAILAEDIRLTDQTPQSLTQLKKRFDALRRHAETSLPRGTGMETVRQMYEDLRKNG